MSVYLKRFVLNLTKNNKEVAKSSFIPGRLRQIERDMESNENLTVLNVMDRLKHEEKLRAALSEHDWKMIEAEVKKMMK